MKITFELDTKEITPAMVGSARRGIAASVRDNFGAVLPLLMARLPELIPVLLKSLSPEEREFLWQVAGFTLNELVSLRDKAKEGTQTSAS